MPSTTPLAFQHRAALQPLRLRLGPQTQGRGAGRTLPLQLWGCSALSPAWPQGQLDIGSTALGLLSLVMRLKAKRCSILGSSEKAVDAVTLPVRVLRGPARAPPGRRAPSRPLSSPWGYPCSLTGQAAGTGAWKGAKGTEAKRGVWLLHRHAGLPEGQLCSLAPCPLLLNSPEARPSIPLLVTAPRGRARARLGAERWRCPGT